MEPNASLSAHYTKTSALFQADVFAYFADFQSVISTAVFRRHKKRNVVSRESQKTFQKVFTFRVIADKLSYCFIQKKVFTLRVLLWAMAYTQINIIVKSPSKKLEAFVRELGVKKNERQEELRSGKDIGAVVKVNK